MKNFRIMIVTVLLIETVISLCGYFPIASNHQNIDSIQYVAHLEEINTTGASNFYNKIDESVYVAASSLSARRMADISTKKVESLSEGSKDHIILVGTKDWSKIEYNGNTSYVSSNDLVVKNISSSSTSSSSSSYKKVDQYLYVSANSLNVRTGPGTSYKKVGVLSRGVKVHRIATGNNGWSKIEYKGNTRYVSSKYLTSSKPSSSSKNSIIAEMKKRGSVGRLKISSVGVDVALFEVSCYDSKKNQDVVDKKDSAAYMTDANDYFGFTIIGDHSNQGFVKMKNSIPGKTTAVIDFGTYKETYICTKKFKGRNVGDLIDLNGKSIAGRNDGGLTMYTCNSDGTVTITFWEKK